MISRETDERDLAWLKARRAGRTAEDIAGEYGVAKETVKVRTLEIRAADAAYEASCGGDPAAVLKAYWSREKGRDMGRKIAMSRIRKDGLRRATPKGKPA